MSVDRVLVARRHEALTDEDRQVLAASIDKVVNVPARRTLVRQDEVIEYSTILVEGLLSRFIDDKTGLRQLVGVHIAGDFVDLHSFPLRALDHGIATLTACTIATVPHRALETIFRDHPELGRKLWYMTLLDAAMHRKWTFRLGRLKSGARVAHFLCEMNARLMAIGLSDGERFALPLTQVDLGEIAGLTSVHVNRVLRDLHVAGLCTFRFGQVEIHDLDGLMRFGQFEPGYLYLTPRLEQHLIAADAAE